MINQTYSLPIQDPSWYPIRFPTYLHSLETSALARCQQFPWTACTNPVSRHVLCHPSPNARVDLHRRTSKVLTTTYPTNHCEGCCHGCWVKTTLGAQVEGAIMVCIYTCKPSVLGSRVDLGLLAVPGAQVGKCKTPWAWPLISFLCSTAHCQNIISGSMQSYVCFFI